MTDIKKLKQLREETNVSYSICKKALEDAKGDIEKAKKILRKEGADMAEKKAGRTTEQGTIFSYIHHNKKVGVLLKMNCETDFVAKNNLFLELGNNISLHIASINPKNTKTLLKEPFVKDPKMTVDELIKENILKLGENISVGSFERYEI